MTTSEIKAVRVFSGDGSTCIGKGVLIGYVTVYATRNMDSGLLSSTSISETTPVGVEYETIENNPKIVMEDGRVVYGCQVWWEPWVDEFTAVAKEDGSAQILRPDGEAIASVVANPNWRGFAPVQIAGLVIAYFNEIEKYMCEKRRTERRIK